MGKRSKRFEPKRNDTTLYIIAGILVLVVGIIIFAVARPTGNVVQGSGEYDEFATCLSDSGAIFYGTEWCGFCQQQKAMFGDSMDFVNFVDCDQNTNVCRGEGISGYPTWVIDGQLYTGVQQFNTLADLTGCEL